MNFAWTAEQTDRNERNEGGNYSYSISRCRKPMRVWMIEFARKESRTKDMV